MQPNEPARKPVAVITNHSYGMGWQVAKLLAANDWTVYGISDSQPPENIEEITTIIADIQWPDEITSAVQEINEPDVDILINCIGEIDMSKFKDITGSDWERVMDLNVKTIWLMTSALIDRMASSKQPMGAGSVINMISQVAKKPITESLLLSISQAAALAATKQMAIDLYSQYGITVLAVTDPIQEDEQKQAAELITYLVSTKERHCYLNGCLVPYGARL